MTYAAGEIVWCSTGRPLFNVPSVCEVELLCRMIGPHGVPCWGVRVATDRLTGRNDREFVVREDTLSRTRPAPPERVEPAAPPEPRQRALFGATP